MSALTTEQNQPSSTEEASQSKKLSQAEAAKRLLAQKKQNQGKGAGGLQSTGTKKMTSQMTKKVNNQRKKMGT
ncbi:MULTISPECIES: hypothetical protein [Paenibacillus]|uniref:hypothetical protein n=1 Tax=Paenibacillus TaxID=44249 RepID=UPI0019C07425|nr:hypothetical protein GCM10008022_36100 [Paenibacillus hunanensis]